MQPVAQVAAHVAHALDRDRHAVQAAIQRAPNAQLDAAENAVGGDRARIAGRGGVSGQAGHIAGGLAGVGQIRGRDADVLGRPVFAADILDRPAQGLEQGRRLLGAGIADDHRLAAAQLQVGHGVLVGHGARQAQGVDHRRLGRGERPHAAAAGGRAAGGDALVALEGR